MLVVGIEKISYLRKKDNTQVEGLKLYCTWSDERNKNLEGEMCETVYIPASRFDSISCLYEIEVGNEIRISYNRFGGVDDIRILEERS